MPKRISEFEQLVLLSALRVGPDAYGARMQEDIASTTGRSVTVAAIYVALSRLEQSGLVSSWMSDPTPVRGGRSKRCYGVEAAGRAALAEARELTERMWSGVTIDLESGSRET